MRGDTNIVLTIIILIIVLVVFFVILITKGGPLANIITNKSTNVSDKLINMFKG